MTFGGRRTGLLSPLVAASALTVAVAVAAGRSYGRRRDRAAARAPMPNPPGAPSGGPGATNGSTSAQEPPLKQPPRGFDPLAAAAVVERAAREGEAVAREGWATRPAAAEPAPLGTPARAAEQLSKAAAALAAGRDGDLEKGVHSARKAIKRARAGVRLARLQIGEKRYRRQNAALAEIGRSLGAARDAKVLVDTLDAVLADASPRERLRLAGLRMLLAAEHEVQAVRLRFGDGIEVASLRLCEAQVRISRWELTDDTPRGLAPGLEDLYRRGRRAARHARKDPTAENLHALRKRAKDLWYAAELLDPPEDSELRRLSREARALTKLIGDDHDLAVLHAKARALRFAFPAKHDRRRLDLRIDARRAQLQLDALDAAREIYGPKLRNLVTPGAGSTRPAPPPD